MSTKKSNAPVGMLPKTNMLRSPLREVVRSGNTSTTEKKGGK